MNRFRQNIIKTIAAALCAGATALASAAPYPERPVTLIVPTGAGGGTDLVARVMSEKLAQALGQPVVIRNRPGAGGIIGNQEAARAAPDGYTLLISSNQFAMIPAVTQKLPYDPVKDFIPITSIGVIPTLVVVGPKAPARSLRELVDYARRNPGELQYASAGVGSPNHLFGELLNKLAGVDVLHVPYQGMAPALLGVASGDATFAYASSPASHGLLSTGKIKAVAVTSRKRLERMPELPAVAEVVAGYDAEIWLGVWGVAKTPQDVIDKVHAALLKTMDDPKVKKGLDELGLMLEPRTQQAFEGVVNDEIAKWVKVVDESNGAIKRQ